MSFTDDMMREWQRKKDRRRKPRSELGPQARYRHNGSFSTGWSDAERLDDALRYYEQTEENEPPTFTRRSW